MADMVDITTQSHDEENLPQLFDDATTIYNSVETGHDPTNGDLVQMRIRQAIAKFEQATNMVSVSGMFSRNESLEELPTETLHYLLLPMYLGTLTLKLCKTNRRELVDVAEVYFRDFIQRCKDYGVTDVEVPHPPEQENGTSQAPRTEADRITSMVRSRDAKIRHYKNMMEMKEKLATLKQTMDSPNVDDNDKREYFITLLQSSVLQALDELASLEAEKPILEYMQKHSTDIKKLTHRERPLPGLKPVIITKDAMQKAVYGLGYPSIPTMTVEEFYDKRVRDGTFPSATNIPHKTIQGEEEDASTAEEIVKERLVEDDDPEELARKRAMDEYKDDHRRGWGNRHNRS